MNRSRMTAAWLALTAFGAQAHPGHGIEAPIHWHASDVWGWVALAVIAVAAVAWGRRK